MTGSPRDSSKELGASDLLIQWLVLAVVRIIGTSRRGVFWVTLGAAGGVAIALLLPKQYTSTATFIAQGASASALPGALQGIAASVGLTSAKDYSPQFYADLLTSNPVLRTALTKRYLVPGSGNPSGLTYLEIEGIEGKDEGLAMEGAMRHLQRRIAARADVRTNIISLGITARGAELSQQIAQTLLDALDSMNIGFRREQSRELREFFEARVAAAQSELDSAETVLRRFLEGNRVIEGSPLLTFEHMRLMRGADLKRAVYTTVVQQYEEAKLQESRNVPVLTVLSPPTLPARKSGPPRRFIVVVGALIGLGVALLHTNVGRLLAPFTTRPRATV